MCLPCPSSTPDCGHVGVAENVVIIVRMVTSAAPTPTGPSEESMLASSASFGGRPYVVVSFEWDTPDHTAPAGQGDVPFHIELTSDDAELDPDTLDVVFSANTTTRDNYFFEAETSGSGDVSVDYSITPHPGQPNSRAIEGTVTLEGDDEPNGFGPLGDFFRGYWGWILLLLLLGIALGAAIRHWMMDSGRESSRPLAL